MALSTGIFDIAPGESPKETDARRKIALSLLQQGSSAEPIRAWTQGAARLAQSLIGGNELYQADLADAQKEAALQRAFGELANMGRQPAAETPPAAPTAAPLPPTPTGNATTVATPTPPGPAPMPSAAAGTLDQTRPPQADITAAATGPAAKPAIWGPSQIQGQQVAMPDAVRQKIAQFGMSNATRPLAVALASEYFKPHLPEYNVHALPNGDIIATNKNDPNDWRMIQPSGQADRLAKFEGQKKTETEKGEAVGQAQVNYGPTVDTAQRALETVQKIREHPGRQYGTGVLGILPGIPGTEQRGFVNLVNQAKSGSFLQAYQTLRGGGQISNAEGAKAEQALQRLDRAQKDSDFESALKDYEDVIRTGLERARKQAGGVPSTSTAAPTTSTTSAADLRKKYGLE